METRKLTQDERDHLKAKIMEASVKTGRPVKEIAQEFLKRKQAMQGGTNIPEPVPQEEHEKLDDSNEGMDKKKTVNIEGIDKTSILPKMKNKNLSPELMDHLKSKVLEVSQKTGRPVGEVTRSICQRMASRLKEIKEQGQEEPKYHNQCHEESTESNLKQASEWRTSSADLESALQEQSKREVQAKDMKKKISKSSNYKAMDIKNRKVDLFKIAIIIILAWIAYSFYNFTENGRYKPYGPDNILLYDSRTGVYSNGNTAKPK